MEKLISGMPQAVCDGAAILGLSAWHLYSDMAVFGASNKEIFVDDELVTEGGVLSLGLSDSGMRESAGVYWSLSFAHPRYYCHPVRKRRRLHGDGTRLSLSQLQLAMLGAVLSHWRASPSELSLAMKLF
jgi:hypothetical protein